MSKFPKEEKLCSIVEIQELFKNKNCFLDYPFSVRFNIKDQSTNSRALVLFSAPKRYHKKAVDRNRIKRLLRECYRCNKEDILIPFLIENKLELRLSITHISNEIPKFELVNRKIISIINKIIKTYQKNNSNEINN